MSSDIQCSKMHKQITQSDLLAAIVCIRKVRSGSLVRIRRKVVPTIGKLKLKAIVGYGFAFTMSPRLR